jgi:hypothetical protein
MFLYPTHSNGVLRTQVCFNTWGAALRVFLIYAHLVVFFGAMRRADLRTAAHFKGSAPAHRFCCSAQLRGYRAAALLLLVWVCGANPDGPAPQTQCTTLSGTPTDRR